MANFVFQSMIPVVDSNGVPISGAKLYVCEPGTTTLASIYTDVGLSVAAANPMVTNSAGFVQQGIIYIGPQTYKIVAKESDSTSVSTGTSIADYSKDNIDPGVPVGAGALPVASGGTGATTAAGARTNLSVPSASEMATATSDISNLQTWTGYTLTTRSRIASGTTAQQPVAGTVGFRYDTTTGRLRFDNGTAFRNVLTAGDVVADDVLSGSVIQFGEHTYATNANITTVIPYDDTIPQITEGDEVLTVTITPKRSDSKMVLTVNLLVGFDGSAITACAAIFKNSGLNAVAASACDNPGADSPVPLTMTYSETLASASAITYSVRVGPTSSTIRLNGISSARRFGGVGVCSLRVWEIRA